jgi:hypothetical protein
VEGSAWGAAQTLALFPPEYFSVVGYILWPDVTEPMIIVNGVETGLHVGISREPCAARTSSTAMMLNASEWGTRCRYRAIVGSSRGLVFKARCQRALEARDSSVMR